MSCNCRSPSVTRLRTWCEKNTFRMGFQLLLVTFCASKQRFISFLKSVQKWCNLEVFADKLETISWDAGKLINLIPVRTSFYGANVFFVSFKLAPKNWQKKIDFFQEYGREMQLCLLKSTVRDDLNGIFSFHFNPLEYAENCSWKSGKMPKNVRISNNSGTPWAMLVKFHVLILEANWNNFAKRQLNRLRLRWIVSMKRECTSAVRSDWFKNEIWPKFVKPPV